MTSSSTSRARAPTRRYKDYGQLERWKTDISVYYTPNSAGIVMYFNKNIPMRFRFRHDIPLPHVPRHGFWMGPFASPPTSSTKSYTKFTLHMETLEIITKRWTTGDLKLARETLGTPREGMTKEEGQAMLDQRDPELWELLKEAEREISKVWSKCLNFWVRSDMVSKKEATFGTLSMIACQVLNDDFLEYLKTWEKLEYSLQPSLWSRFSTWITTRAFIDISNFNLREVF